MAFLQIFLAILFIILYLILLAPKNRLLPWNWPFIKLMPTIYLKSHQMYDKITHILGENKGTVLFQTSWFTNHDVLMTSDPANVQYIMNTKFTNYQRGSGFRDAFDFLGEAVFIKDLDEWKEDKKFTHAFYKENDFKTSTPKIIHHALEKGLIPILNHMSRRKEVFDLQNLFNRFMLDATCIMATGFESGCLRVGFPDCPLLTAMDDIGEAVFYRHILPDKVWKLQRWLKIGKEKKMFEASQTFNKILEDFVSRKLELASKNQGIGENFDVLKFYLEEAKGSTKHGNKVYLAANMMTLLFAGRDTSGALLTWFFHLISTNPKVKTKILEEIRQLNIPSQQHIFSNVEEVSKLVYLHCALYESLRLFPPVPVLIRDPIEEDVLPSGHKVDRTTKVILCSYAMGRMPEIWGDDCSEFKPERWLSDKGGLNHVSTNNFIAFGAGPWACPGRELGFSRMKGVVATMLHNFHVDVVEGQRISPSVSALLTMNHGLKAVVSSRWD